MIGLANLCCFGRALASRTEKSFDEWRVFPISLWPTHQPCELNHQSWECSIMRIKPSIMGIYPIMRIEPSIMGIYPIMGIEAINHGNLSFETLQTNVYVACWHAGMLGRLKNQTCILRTCGHQKYVKVNYKATLW